MNAAPVVYGLILAGGASSRMQRDKAALPYQGRSQLDRAYELLARHVDPVFVSVRSGKTVDATRAARPLIEDAFEGGGPLIGIRSAMARVPGVAWLVLACDLPFLTAATLEQLLAARDPQRLATAFRSAHDRLPEPLCAIWEPAAAAALAGFAATGRSCPRKFLSQADVRLVDLADPRALDNVNTPEEYAAALRELDAEPRREAMHIKIQYYAVLREQAGRSEETLETTAATPSDLYSELHARYGFSLGREQLKVAVNSEFCDWQRPLAAGDAVVFLPPVAGG